MHKGLILHKFANQVVPATFFTKVLEQFNGSFGAAVVTKDKEGKDVFISMKIPEPATMEGLDSLQETFLDDPALLFFGASTNKVITPESLQPFDLLLNKAGEPVLMGFIEGTFPGYAEEKSAHSEAFFMVEKYLRSKLAKIYRYADSDMAKVLEELRDPSIKQDIANTITNRGQVTLLSITGDVITYGEKNTSLVEFPWGWASQSCGYEEKPATAPKVEVKQSALAAMVSRKAATASAPAPEPAKEPQKTVITSVPAVAPPKTETAVIAGPRKYQPSKTLHGKKLRRAYQVNAGFVPDNYATHPEVVSQVHQTLADIHPSQVKTVEQAPSQSVSKRDNKDTTVHHVSQTADTRAEAEKVAAPSKPVIKVPLMSSDTKAGLHKAFSDGKLLKVLDKNSQEIMPPSEIQKVEKRLPNFAVQTGMSGLEVTFQWDYQKVLENLSLEALAVLWHSTKSAYMNCLTENAALQDKITKLEAQVAGQATKLPKTSTKADPAPEAKVEAPAPAAATGMMSHMVSRRKVA